eukprot:2712211-Prymnesium_polylepis.2
MHPPPPCAPSLSPALGAAQFVQLMNELRAHVVSAPNLDVPSLLGSLAARTSFAQHLDKQAARTMASRGAFTVRVRGGPSGSHSASARLDGASTDDESS